MIKLFLRKVIIFFSILFLFGLIIIIFLSLILSPSIKNYKIDSNISEIFIGDSHIRTAINDNLLKNSKNLGRISETFYFSYFKLKVIIASNPKIERVYLGFSYHNLSNYYDEVVKGNRIKTIPPKYFYILPFTERIRQITWNIKKPQFYKGIIMTGIHDVFSKMNYDFLGGYSNDFINVSASKALMDKRIFLNFHSKAKIREFSAINLSYLDSIIHLCETENVELIFLKTPLHTYYRRILPIEYINLYNHIIEIKEHEIIDFSALPLDDNCFVPDGDHVSEKGALTLTKEFLKFKNNCRLYKN